MKKIEYQGNKNMIHAKLRAFRAEAGLSQGELAAKLQTMDVNIDQQMISKIEHNARMVTDYELVCICRALRVEVGEMLAGFDKEI